MARTVDDVSMMFEVMAKSDPARLMVRNLVPPTSPSDLRGLRVACITSIDGLVTDSDVEAGVRAAMNLLESAGAVVRYVDFPWSWERLFRSVTLAFASVYMAQAKRLHDSGAPLSDLTLGFIDDVEPVISDYGYAVDARAEMAQLQQDLGAILQGVDIIAMPTLQIPAPIAGEHFLEAGPLIEGVPSQDRWIVAFTVPFNLASACPAITLPAGWSSDGIPTAVQLVGRPYQDLDLLRWAGHLEGLLIESNRHEGVRSAGE
jgi:aspartyl-tRNA(Asn)/glutamyl-tRNA(Gln) amidotransferase subunit A